jgi:hypothetical protein
MSRVPGACKRRRDEDEIKCQLQPSIASLISAVASAGPPPKAGPNVRQSKASPALQYVSPELQLLPPHNATALTPAARHLAQEQACAVVRRGPPAGAAVGGAHYHDAQTGRGESAQQPRQLARTQRVRHDGAPRARRAIACRGRDVLFHGLRSAGTHYCRSCCAPRARPTAVHHRHAVAAAGGCHLATQAPLQARWRDLRVHGSRKWEPLA